MSMIKDKKTTFFVEGPNWETEVMVDTVIHDDERSQLIEAATLAIEQKIDREEDLQLGAVILVRKTKKSSKEAMVNAYICLVNAAQYKMAENLRKNFQKESGTDLATDQNGFSY
jgi:hypothetical protein